MIRVVRSSGAPGEVSGFGPAREHFVDGQEHRIRL
jgi:hypothetical protein